MVVLGRSGSYWIAWILGTADKRRNGACWSVALAVGIRQSEAIGLRWQFADLETGTVEVGWQLKRARYWHGCDDPVACAAKGHRIPCPPRCKGHQHHDNCPPDCTALSHICPMIKRPCRPGCRAHARECPQRTGGGWQLTRRKGVKAGQGKAKLMLALPAPLVEQLKAHPRQQAAERLAAVQRGGRSGTWSSARPTARRSTRATTGLTGTRCFERQAAGKPGFMTPGTLPPPSCSSRASACASSRRSWATPSSARPSAIPTSPGP